MLYIALLNNITLLIALAVVHSFLVRSPGKESVLYELMSGTLFGVVAIIGMINSVELQPGLIFDGRSIILAIAGIFGGPVTAVVSVVISAVYRIILGGTGTVMGVSVIIESALFGTLLFFLRKRYGWASGGLAFYITGLLVHVVMLLLTVFLRDASPREVLSQVMYPVLLIYPVATLLVGLLFQSQANFIRAKLKSEESDRLKTAFLNNLSHEIRTPLNAIVGFSEMVTDQSIKDDDRRRFNEIIFKSSGQLLSMIDDILDVASIEAGEVTINKKVVHVNSILDHISTQFLFKAERNNIKVNVMHLQDDKDNMVFTDETKLIQILANLTGNAIKFSKDGIVTIECRERTGDYLFSVSDTGIGIDPDNKEIIFERFRQGSPEISSTYGGTGLGLSIAKSYVELLGGRIWVESEPDKGSTFFFTLPKS
ncbi:MAG: sensor histidine kinase [Bacteroidales bacterium]|nr:sensor histidine kinase [Bacteroidales bacterium]